MYATDCLLPVVPTVFLDGTELPGRNLSDWRDESCVGAGLYNLQGLPDTTVVMVILPREQLAPVLRTVYSILARTPPELLREILVMDDTVPGGMSWLDDQEALSFAKTIPKVRVVFRPAGMPERRGVLGARAAAVDMALGDTVTFIDSHAEVQDGWLEPMLSRIAANRKTVVFPKLDWEDPGSWATHRGGIGCTLGMLWSPLSEHEVAEQAKDAVVRQSDADAMPSPVLFGAVFSVHRESFLEMGGFDLEYGYGGGDNMELGFRTWMCGGRVECAPCSRVYIVFYKKSQNGATPGHHYSRNKLRTASLWMDDHGAFVKTGIGKGPPNAAGPLTARQQLRNRLQCKSFQWFLDNVYPENEIVKLPGDIVILGPIQSSAKEKWCIDTLQRLEFGKTVGVYNCNNGWSQKFVLLGNGHIMPLSKMEICLDYSLKWARCGTIAGQKQREKKMGWRADFLSGTIQTISGSKCLTLNGKDMLLAPCCQDESDACQHQSWKFSSYTDFMAVS
jgi:polypeptide N-acetylgalactosaminyltransferase